MGTDRLALENVARLLRRMYATRGYRTEGFNELRRDSDPSEEITLGVSTPTGVCGTIGVRVDGPTGLRADSLYRSEIDATRNKGGRPCEFARFALERGIGSLEVMGSLFHLAYVYARELRAATDLFVEVNPRHAVFYQRMLGLAQVGAERTCPRVDAPAVLLHLDLRYAAEQIGRHREGTQPVRGTLYRMALAESEVARVKRRIAALLPQSRTSSHAAPAAIPYAYAREHAVALQLATGHLTYAEGVHAGAAARSRHEAISSYQRVALGDYERGFRAGYFVGVGAVERWPQRTLDPAPRT